MKNFLIKFAIIFFMIFPNSRLSAAEATYDLGRSESRRIVISSLYNALRQKDGDEIGSPLNRIFNQEIGTNDKIDPSSIKRKDYVKGRKTPRRLDRPRRHAEVVAGAAAAPAGLAAGSEFLSEIGIITLLQRFIFAIEPMGPTYQCLPPCKNKGCFPPCY